LLEVMAFLFDMQIVQRLPATRFRCVPSGMPKDYDGR